MRRDRGEVDVTDCMYRRLFPPHGKVERKARSILDALYSERYINNISSITGVRAFYVAG